MVNKKYTPNQLAALSFIQDKESITASSLQRHLRCSLLKAFELLNWLHDKDLVGAESPRTINTQELKKII